MNRISKNLKEVIVIWLPLMVTITLICGLVYLISQQTIRLSANNQQVEIAKDYANLLTNGIDVQNLLPKRKIDLANNLNTFVIIFNDKGNVLFSSAILDNQTPTPPISVLDNVRSIGETRITWQPKINVRSAIVIDRFEGLHPGFILVGKSLKETESLEDKILNLTALAWISTIFISFFAVAFTLKIASKFKG
jgi:hypothetical protein